MPSTKKKTRQSFIPTETNIYKKSNFLIGAKYKSTLLENKIMAVSLANADKFSTTSPIQIRPGKENEPGIYSVMKVSELRHTLGANDGSFYRQLDEAAKSMAGKTVGMSSADSRTFSYMAVVTAAVCRDGIFVIEYNHYLKDELQQIQKNYSRLNLTIMLKFTSNYSFRMYELLKSKCYRSKGDADQSNVYNIRFGLSELKLELGIVNAELQTVKKILNGSDNPDFDQAVDASPERMFDDWSNFRRKVLDRGVKEINAISDMHVEYETEKSGAGGKVHAVDFTVTVGQLQTDGKKVNIVAQEMSEEDKLDVIIKAAQILGTGFNTKDVRTICQAAFFDLGKIETAYGLFQKQKDVKNPTGWMIAAIRGEYEDTGAVETTAEEVTPGKGTKKRSSRAQQTVSFNSFRQNDYDFDQLEEQLAAN